MSKSRHYRDDQFVRLLGARIRQLRKSKNLTISSLAEDCGFEYVQLSRIERGLINPNISQIKKITDTLGVTLSSVVEGL